MDNLFRLHQFRLTALTLLVGVCALSSAVQTINPVSGSAYLTESQSTPTSELVNNPIDLANNIICHWRETQVDNNPDGQAYLAWVGSNSCANSLSQSDLSQGEELVMVYNIDYLGAAAFIEEPGITSASEGITLGIQSKLSQLVDGFELCNPSSATPGCDVGRFSSSDAFDGDPRIAYDGVGNNSILAGVQCLQRA